MAKGYYYYDPICKKHYKSLYAAVYSELYTDVVQSTIEYDSEIWRKLSNPLWCDDHVDQVCELIGLLKTKTRSKAEVKFKMWYYRMLTRLCCREQ